LVKSCEVGRISYQATEATRCAIKIKKTNNVGKKL
jgi:hypothetical protein